MNASWFNGDDDREVHGNPGASGTQRALFAATCDGAVRAVRMAADPTVAPWSAYVGDRLLVAIWSVRHVMRTARALGLYPSTTQLDAESRVAA